MVGPGAALTCDAAATAKNCEPAGGQSAPPMTPPPQLLPALAGLLVLVAGAARADDPPDPPALPAPPQARCSIVFGQGRNAAEGDDDANAVWDQVNFAFNGEVATRLKSAGVPVLTLVLRVTAADRPGNLDKLLQRAQAAQCDAIVETTVYADYAARTLVARLRDLPVVDDAAGLRLGPPRYAVERNFELNRSTLDRVRPAALAADMTSELLAHGRR